MELINLAVYDLDTERGTVMVRQGKGKKDRMVPIGERALAWIERYLERSAARARVPARTKACCFSRSTARRSRPKRLTQLVREYVKRAELGKTRRRAICSGTRWRR